MILPDAKLYSLWNGISLSRVIGQKLCLFGKLVNSTLYSFCVMYVLSGFAYGPVLILEMIVLDAEFRAISNDVTFT